MKLYSTIIKKAEYEETIEKSRFIAHALPVQSREEAEEFIQEVRRQYRDATHNVPAMVIGDKMQIQWASDDGEPQGTSGAPIVQMLTNSKITNICVVVTRYFGGIKLGPGGLVRAYTKLAKGAVANAGVCDVSECELLTFEIDYSSLKRIQSLKNADFNIEDIKYSDTVILKISCIPEATCDIINSLGNITNGKAILISQEEALIKEQKNV